MSEIDAGEIDGLKIMLADVLKQLAWHTGNPLTDGMYEVFANGGFDHDLYRVGEGPRDGWMNVVNVEYWRYVPAVPESPFSDNAPF